MRKPSARPIQELTVRNFSTNSPEKKESGKTSRLGSASVPSTGARHVHAVDVVLPQTNDSNTNKTVGSEESTEPIVTDTSTSQPTSPVMAGAGGQSKKKRRKRKAKSNNINIAPEPSQQTDDKQYKREAGAEAEIRHQQIQQRPQIQRNGPPPSRAQSPPVEEILPTATRPQAAASPTAASIKSLSVEGVSEKTNRFVSAASNVSPEPIEVSASLSNRKGKIGSPSSHISNAPTHYTDCDSFHSFPLDDKTQGTRDPTPESSAPEVWYDASSRQAQTQRQQVYDILSNDTEMRRHSPSPSLDIDVSSSKGSSPADGKENKQGEKKSSILRTLTRSLSRKSTPNASIHPTPPPHTSSAATRKCRESGQLLAKLQSLGIMTEEDSCQVSDTLARVMQTISGNSSSDSSVVECMGHVVDSVHTLITQLSFRYEAPQLVKDVKEVRRGVDKVHRESDAMTSATTTTLRAIEKDVKALRAKLKVVESVADAERRSREAERTFQRRESAKQRSRLSLTSPRLSTSPTPPSPNVKLRNQLLTAKQNQKQLEEKAELEKKKAQDTVARLKTLERRCTDQQHELLLLREHFNSGSSPMTELTQALQNSTEQLRSLEAENASLHKRLLATESVTINSEHRHYGNIEILNRCCWVIVNEERDFDALKNVLMAFEVAKKALMIGYCNNVHHAADLGFRALLSTIPHLQGHAQPSRMKELYAFVQKYLSAQSRVSGKTHQLDEPLSEASETSEAVSWAIGVLAGFQSEPAASPELPTRHKLPTGIEDVVSPTTATAAATIQEEESVSDYRQSLSLSDSLDSAVNFLETEKSQLFEQLRAMDRDVKTLARSHQDNQQFSGGEESPRSQRLRATPTGRGAPSGSSRSPPPSSSPRRVPSAYHYPTPHTQKPRSYASPPTPSVPTKSPSRVSPNRDTTGRLHYSSPTPDGGRRPAAADDSWLRRVFEEPLWMETAHTEGIPVDVNSVPCDAIICRLCQLIFRSTADLKRHIQHAASHKQNTKAFHEKTRKGFSKAKRAGRQADEQKGIVDKEEEKSDGAFTDNMDDEIWWRFVSMYAKHTGK